MPAGHHLVDSDGWSCDPVYLLLYDLMTPSPRQLDNCTGYDDMWHHLRTIAGYKFSNFMWLPWFANFYWLASYMLDPTGLAIATYLSMLRGLTNEDNAQNPYLEFKDLKFVFKSLNTKIYWLSGQTDSWNLPIFGTQHLKISTFEVNLSFIYPRFSMCRTGPLEPYTVFYWCAFLKDILLSL